MRESLRGFAIGLAAGALALALSFLLRNLAGAPFVPELAAQTVFSLVPGKVESQAVESLGSLAKYSAFTGAVIVNLLFYGVLGTFLYGLYRRIASKGYFINGIHFSLFAYSTLLAAAIIFTRTSEVLTQPVPIQFLLLYLLPPNLTFGLTLAFLFSRRIMKPILLQEKTVKERTEFVQRRRTLIRAGLIAAIAATVLFYGLNPLLSRLPNFAGRRILDPANRLAAFLAGEVTPNERFYRVDVDITPPTVDVSAWTLNVKGLVGNPMSLTYEEMRAMPAVEQYNTLECISNRIGGDLISTAQWKGVRLNELLAKAQVRPEATYVVFRCRDGYDVGIPLERGLREGTLLAYQMNGATLPVEHGFPLRAIVPGFYGMMNPKWISEIELVSKTYLGFWQRRGWANEAEYQTHSLIAMPGDSLNDRFGELGASRTVVGTKIPIAGVAFAGDRGIEKVDVSVDGGRTWEPAGIKSPLSANTWVLWSYEWVPKAKGQYKIAVRATDRTGKVQAAELRDPFPSGATAYHIVDLRVEEET